MRPARRSAMADKAQASDGSPLKFIGGLIVGIALTSGYVKWGWSKPAILEVPEKVTASVLAATATEDLYNLDQPLEVRRRALEVVAQQRPDEILKVDAEELDHALLNAFYRRRARRQARQLSMQWTAYDAALSKPSLRTVLEREYGTSDDTTLKQAMLFKAFREEPFLSAWIRSEHGAVSPATLLPVLHEVRQDRVALDRLPAQRR